MEEVTSISIELVNKAYIYLFMTSEFTIKSAIEPYIKTDPFTYNTATAIAL